MQGFPSHLVYVTFFCSGGLPYLPLVLLLVCTSHLCDSYQPDSQVVAHILRPASLGGAPTGLPHHPAPQAPPHPSRLPSWDVLLHHYRFVFISSRGIINQSECSVLSMTSYGLWNESQAGHWVLSLQDGWTTLWRSWVFGGTWRILSRVWRERSPGLTTWNGLTKSSNSAGLLHPTSEDAGSVQASHALFASLKL